MKKKKYESVNEIRRNGIFTRNHFRTYENRMDGCIACPSGNETKYYTVVMFRDKTTGKFPWENLFVGGKKVVFTGRTETRRNPKTDKVYDEIILQEIHENVPVEVEVPDDDTQAERRQERRYNGGGGYGGYRRPQVPRKPNPDFSQAAGLEAPPEGLFDDGGDQEF